ncbi:Uncharacterized protein BP5553_10377 [Venustampulla echinocandica]|uniref:C2H2-type domain-containing protein n=1 Tax=Venustampulla echinocandica TaxID=2656787 RepID=A0A370TA13_9HELO|nr:Uncharacterized protein BP5553_10377 [Venustampulla echinocandica]RDL30499.1 Uncharacterized protein BP5553_10377 [Venustampulla echinocandica]
MPAIRQRLGSRDLLEYDARYGVLICRECQYAIQKSALQSHLLRHKIYRLERQRLLSSIAELDLLEPDHVPLPTPTSSPIEALPTFSGYCCAAAGCGNLCVSSKRMKRHWSEIHGLSEPPPDFSSFARPVKLQTFFRGTKLRYFEVASSPAGTAGAARLAATDSDGGDEMHDEGHNEERHGHQSSDEQKNGEQWNDAGPSASPRVPTPLGAPSPSSLVDFDLETLTYFHHFITTTSLTLPGAENPQLITHYWKTDFVPQALRRRWLMCGLLAISTCHLAALADNTTIARVYCERSAQFLTGFCVGREETVQRDSGTVTTGVEEEAKAGRQVSCVLSFAHWALAELRLNLGITPEPAAPRQLQSIMTTIQSFEVAHSTRRPAGGSRRLESFANAKRILEMSSSLDAGSIGACSSSHNIPSALLDCLRTLPSRMAEMFGRPDSGRDVLATLSAIAALAECCETSFASDDVGPAWRGMAAWLTKVPDRFNQMVSRRSPAALVVLAHWAAWLVKRAEDCGCWFLKGTAKTILLQIAERLPADDRAVQTLLEGL